LPDLLDALMRALAERVRLKSGALVVDGLGTLAIARVRGETASEWLPSGAGTGAVPLRPGGDALILPIRYAGARLGELRLDMVAPPGSADLEMQLLCHFARQCGLLVKRYDVRRWSEQRLGRALLLIGMSKALRELEQFVEIAAVGYLPVLLRGEFGTEKAQLAAAIHCCSPAAEGPFVQIDCAEPASPPTEWMAQANGGTLYLSDIDELEPRLQKQLPQILPTRLDQRLPAPRQCAVRVIASTTADLYARARAGQFSRPLLAELDFLSVTIPPLRERTEDIEPLICHVLERNGFEAEAKTTEALVALCRAHDWPENLFELERMIARLAVMTEGRPIQLRDIFRHAPALSPSPTAAEEQTARQDGSSKLDGWPENWVRCATEGGEVRGLHEALRKALAYLGQHYDQPITLGQLARHAGVSASHLSHLFRSAIGMPFKALLRRIRILKARELLKSGKTPNITQVALDVGFSDLSHFERSFRRIVGESPREFRRRASVY
jgi:DNA-binding NtrC family response regulator